MLPNRKEKIIVALQAHSMRIISLGLLSLLLAVGLTESGCGRKKLQANAPVLVPVDSVFVPPLSTIYIPVKIHTNELARDINKELGTVLYDDQDAKDDYMKIRITKLRDIAISTVKNNLTVTIPLNIDIVGEVDLNPSSFGPSVMTRKSANFKTTITLQSFVGFNSNWSLRTASIASYKWDENPVLSIGPVNLPLKTVLDKVMSSKKAEISRQVDAEIANYTSFRSYANDAWHAMKMPIEVSKSPLTHLNINPKTVSASPVTCKDGIIAFDLGITASVFAYLGAPKANRIGELPELTKTNEVNKTCNITLLNFLDYGTLTEIAKGYVVQPKPFELDKGYEAKVLSIALSGNSNLINISAEIEGGKASKKKRTKASVFLEGRPIIDSVTGLVKIVDLRFHVDSKNMLLKSASWFLDAFFLKTIQKQLTFNYQEMIEEQRSQINVALFRGIKPVKGVRITGNVSSIRPVSAATGPSGITAAVQAIGSIEVHVEGLGY